MACPGSLGQANSFNLYLYLMSFPVLVTPQLESILLKSLIALIKDEGSADAIVSAANVINYFADARGKYDEEQKKTAKKESGEIADEEAPKTKSKKT
jgi:hypothetical protein